MIEALAEAAHDAWMAEKLRRGVTSWPNEAGIEQLVPYAVLDDSIREFDRVVVRAIMARAEITSPSTARNTRETP
jgi:hypothetical protein